MDNVFWLQTRDTVGLPMPPEPLSVIREFGYHYITEYWDFRRPGTERDDALLLITVDGQARVHHGDESVEVKAGDVTFYNVNENHHYTTEGWEVFFFHWYPSEHLKKSFQHSNISSQTWHEVLDHSYLLSLDELRSYAQPAQLEHFRRCAVLVEDVMYRCVAPRSGTANYMQRFRTYGVLNYMRNHLSEPVKIDQLAAMMHLSTSRFNHLFREEVGQSPMQYMKMLRLNKARHLMRVTDLPVNQIAQEVGYEDPLYFRRAFKQHFQVTPSQAREHDRNMP